MGRRARATRVATEEGLQSPVPVSHHRWQLLSGCGLTFCGFLLGAGGVMLIAGSGPEGPQVLEAGLLAITGLTLPDHIPLAAPIIADAEAPALERETEPLPLTGSRAAMVAALQHLPHLADDEVRWLAGNAATTASAEASTIAQASPRPSPMASAELTAAPQNALSPPSAPRVPSDALVRLSAALKMMLPPQLPTPPSPSPQPPPTIPPMAPPPLPISFTAVRDTNCWEGHGAKELNGANGAAPGVHTREACEEACLILPRCNAILLTKKSWEPAACYRKELLAVEDCASDPTIDLFTIPRPPMPPSHPLPLPPPRPPPRPPYGHGTADQVAAELNRRFVSGLNAPGTDMPGVLVHVFDGFVRQWDSPWRLQEVGGVPPDRLSATLINAQLPSKVFREGVPGFVLSAAHNSILCSWAGASSRLCRQLA